MRQCVHALRRKEHIELTSRMNSQCMLSDAPHPLICDPTPCETDVGWSRTYENVHMEPRLTRFMQRACATSAALQYSDMCDMWHALMPEHKHKFAQRAPTARARWPDHSCVAVSCSRTHKSRPPRLFRRDCVSGNPHGHGHGAPSRREINVFQNWIILFFREK
jgi:hypothetical protein